MVNEGGVGLCDRPGPAANLVDGRRYGCLIKAFELNLTISFGDNIWSRGLPARSHFAVQIPSRLPDLQFCNSTKISIVGRQICQTVSSHNCKMGRIHS